MKKLILPVIIFYLLSIGCVTVGPLNTPTGKPEIAINDTLKKEVADTIINQMLSWDFQLQTQSDSVLTFGKKDTRVMSSALLGSGYDGIPEWRFIYNIVDYASGVRVVANIFAVTNPGSAFERMTDLSRGSRDANNVQSFFENMKNEYTIKAVTKGRGKVGVKFDKNNIIKGVVENSPAQKAGLLIGDHVIAVDGESLSETDIVGASMRMTGEPGSTVLLLIKRDDRELLIPVVRGNP